MAPLAWQIGAAAVTLGAGLALSSCVEPGVRIERTTLANGIPALHFLPAEPPAGKKPAKALLAHGVTASKETLFRFGEALAAAGIEGYAIDLPGHGDSSSSYLDGENVETLEHAARALGGPDFFVGHSMGAYAGGEAVSSGGLAPRLFVAVGALPQLGLDHPPPLLLLAGRFEEAVSPGRLRARASVPGARLVVSPWSDHALEPYDPVLVHAAVDAACASMGTVSPPRPWRWGLRLAGGAMAAAAALWLGHLAFVFPGRARWLRGPALVVGWIAVLAIAGRTWIGAAPTLRHLPAQLAVGAGAWVACVVARRIGVPRWIFGAGAAALAAACLARGKPFEALFAGLLASVVLAATCVAWLAERRGGAAAAETAFALFVGYALGQWTPVPF